MRATVVVLVAFLGPWSLLGADAQTGHGPTPAWMPPVDAWSVETSGTTTMAGPVHLLLLETRPGSRFDLTATTEERQLLRIEAVELDRNVTGSPPTSMPLGGLEMDGAGVAWANGSYLTVVPLAGRPAPTATLQDGRAYLEAERRATVRDPLWPGISGPGANYGVAGGRVGEATDGLHIEVQGAFRLRLWGWNGTYDGSTSPFSTGRVRVDVRDLGAGTATSPASPAQGPVIARYRLQWLELDVADGRLELAAQTTGNSSLVFQHLHGTTEGRLVVNMRQRAPLVREGPVEFQASFGDGGTQVSLPSAARGDGSAGPSYWPTVSTVVGALVLAAVGVGTLRHRMGGDAVVRALHRHDGVAAARLARRRRPRDAQDAAARAVAFLQAGEPARAEAEIGRFPLPQGDRLFFLACVRVRQGRTPEARDLLARCLQADPSYAKEVPLNADLAPLLADLAGRSRQDKSRPGAGSEGYS